MCIVYLQCNYNYSGTQLNRFQKLETRVILIKAVISRIPVRVLYILVLLWP